MAYKRFNFWWKKKPFGGRASEKCLEMHTPDFAGVSVPKRDTAKVYDRVPIDP